MREEPACFRVRAALVNVPFVIRKSDPACDDMVKTVRRALDYRGALHYESEPDRPDHLVRIELLPGSGSRPPDCPDSDAFTPEFWATATADGGVVDQVRWLFDRPDCRSVHVYMDACATQRLLHRTHPRFDELLRLASKSLDEEGQITMHCCRDFPLFIADLRRLERS